MVVLLAKKTEVVYLEKNKIFVIIYSKIDVYQSRSNSWKLAVD